MKGITLRNVTMSPKGIPKVITNTLVVNSVRSVFLGSKPQVIKLKVHFSSMTLHWTQMADGTFKFMIGHLKLVSSGQQDYKVCDWSIETGLGLSLRLVSDGQSQTLKSTRPSCTLEPRPNGLVGHLSPA